MALVNTSISGAVALGDSKVSLTSATGVSVGMLMQVDGEWMLITDVTNSPTVSVVRGYGNGLTTSTARAHNILAPVTYGLTSEFTQTTNGSTPNAGFVSYSVDGAIALPGVDTVVYINKAGVCALTLANPAADSRVAIKFVSLTAYAHTITYTAGFYDNTTSSDVATFPATAGGTIEIIAINGKWRPLATVATAGVTLG